jgi:hypothetical protein
MKSTTLNPLLGRIVILLLSMFVITCSVIAQGRPPIITHPPPGWPPPPHPPVDHQPPPPKPKVKVQHVSGLSMPLLLVPVSLPMPKGSVTIDTEVTAANETATISAATVQPLAARAKVVARYMRGLLKPLLLVPESVSIPQGTIVIEPASMPNTDRVQHKRQKRKLSQTKR